MKKGKEYELLIEQIYKELQKDAIIKQDDYIMGVESGIERQIDLTIRHKIADVDVLIIVQAKEWQTKADVKVVGEFVSVIRDVRAQKGILICLSGFSKAALDYAKKERISTYSAHSALNTRWKLELNIPIIRTEQIFLCDFDIMFPVTGGETFTMNNISEHNILLRDNKPIPLHEILAEAINGKPIDKSGKVVRFFIEHQNLYSTVVNGQWRRVENIRYSYKFKKIRVSTALFNPTDYRVLKDYAENTVKPTYINYDRLIPLLGKKDSWKTISNEEQVTIKKAPYIDMKATSMDFLYTFSFDFINKLN